MWEQRYFQKLSRNQRLIIRELNFNLSNFTITTDFYSPFAKKGGVLLCICDVKEKKRTHCATLKIRCGRRLSTRAFHALLHARERSERRISSIALHFHWSLRASTAGDLARLPNSDAVQRTCWKDDRSCDGGRTAAAAGWITAKSLLVPLIVSSAESSRILSISVRSRVLAARRAREKRVKPE